MSGLAFGGVRVERRPVPRPDRASDITGATLALDAGNSIGTVAPTVPPTPGPPG
jgi:hypothetical protein